MEHIKNEIDNIRYILKSNRKLRFFAVLFALVSVLTIILNVMVSNNAVATISQFNNLASKYEFILGGEVAGIKILSNGVLIIGVDNQACGLKEGDILLKLDGVSIETNQDIIEYINTENVKKAGKVEAIVKRGEKEFSQILDIKYSESTQKYELGLWVKDSSAGVGTITYYEKNNGYFAALGHGITETRESVVVPITSGAIVKASIEGIKKGEPKEPGDMKGVIYKEVIGQIYKNTVNGIFGKLEQIENKDVIQVASKHEIQEGTAYIYCSLDDNEVKKYEIKINSVLKDSTGNKNMVIQVTDKALIEKTGGIVQGMSGSPIVQNGKLIGAVTHVFLNDPTKGYAVFIENMINDMSIEL